MQNFTKKSLIFCSLVFGFGQGLFAQQVNVAAGSNLLADVKSQVSLENLNIVLQRIVESTTEALQSVPEADRFWLERYVLAMRAAGPVVQDFLAKAKKFTLNNKGLTQAAGDNLDNFLTHFNKMNTLGADLFTELAKVSGVKSSGVVARVINGFPASLKDVTASTQASLSKADFSGLVNSVLISQTSPEVVALKNVLDEWQNSSDSWIDLARQHVNSTVTDLLGKFAEGSGTLKDVGTKINSEVERLQATPEAATSANNSLTVTSNNTGANVQASRTAATQSQTRVAVAPAVSRSSIAQTTASNSSARTQTNRVAKPVAVKAGSSR